MTAKILKWAKAPPCRTAAANEYDEAVTLLQTRPGEWGMVKRVPGQTAHGRDALKSRGCEVSSTHRDGHTETWAMWPKGKELEEARDDDGADGSDAPDGASDAVGSPERESLL